MTSREGWVSGWILKSVPDALLIGLPIDDQQAILNAVGKPVLFVAMRDDGKAELEFRDHLGNIHTIWVEPEHYAAP